MGCPETIQENETKTFGVLYMNTLNLEYDYDSLVKRFYFLQNTWLATHKTPRILITGANSWLAHYLLTILIPYKTREEVLLIDAEQRADYLQLGNFQKLKYIQLNSKLQDLQKIIKEFCPQLIFHCDYIWKASKKNLKELYETNVLQVELLCSIAQEVGVERVILFSDSQIYGKENSIAEEKQNLCPQNYIGKSFQLAEEIAWEYYSYNKLGAYHVRMAPLYGHIIPTGIMSVAHLIEQGFLLFAPTEIPEKVSVLSGKDLALGAFLLAFAPRLNYRVFNLATSEIELLTLLKYISESLPKNKIFGINSRLASIMKIGYQDQVRMPINILQFLAGFRERTTDFFNQIRLEKEEEKLTKDKIDYISSLRVFSQKRIYNTLGWYSSFDPEYLKQCVGDSKKYLWNQKKEVTDKNFLDIENFHDKVGEVVNTLSKYNYQDAQYEFLTLPLLNFKIDTKSLFILVERAWSCLWMAVIKEQKGNNIKKIQQAFPEIGKKILKMVQYEHGKAKRLFPDNKAKQVKWLFKQLGELDRQKLGFYSKVIIISNIIKKIHEILKKYQKLSSLLPLKNYGIFFTSKIGDIAIVCNVEKKNIAVNFIRKQIDIISQAQSLEKKLKEFKKKAHLHIVLGGNLDQFFMDIF